MFEPTFEHLAQTARSYPSHGYSKALGLLLELDRVQQRKKRIARELRALGPAAAVALFHLSAERARRQVRVAKKPL